MPGDSRTGTNGRHTLTTIDETERAGVYELPASGALVKIAENGASDSQSVSVVESSEGGVSIAVSDDEVGVSGGNETMVVERFRVFKKTTNKCSASWYARQDYTHRYQGASVTFVDQPQTFDKYRLEAAIEAIAEAIRRRTRLGGWGIFPLNSGQIRELTQWVGKKNDRKVTMGGWDTDKFGQLGPTALLQFGIGPGTEVAASKLTSLWGSDIAHMAQLGGTGAFSTRD